MLAADWGYFVAEVCVNALFSLWNLVLQPLIWKINGVHKELESVFSPRADVRRVQVLRVIVRLPFPHVPSPNSFITVHERFADFDDAILSSAILFRVSIKHDVAELVELDGIQDPYDVNAHPMLHSVQMKRATKLIRVRLSHFLSAAKRLEVKQKKVVWMMQSLRCGSTAWAQIFHSLPGWAVISEPMPLVHTFYTEVPFDNVVDFVESPIFKDVIEAAFKSYLSHLKAECVLVKGTIFDQYLIPAIEERFPCHDMAFAYRNALPSAKSYFKAFNVPATKFACEKLAEDSQSENPAVVATRNLYSQQYPLAKKLMECEATPTDVFEWYILTWCAAVHFILSKQQDGTKVLGLKYEHLRADERGYLSAVFSLLGIDPGLVSVAVAALEKDSQEGLFYSRDKVRKNASWTRMERSVEKVNRLLKGFGLPDLDSDYTLPCTLSLNNNDCK